MYRIKTMNKIASAGLDQLDKSRFQVGEDVENEDGILVRSAKMHDYVFPDALRAIARAGAGTNNIPIDRCSESGIVVFNTPGANANAVKELVIAALLIASRDIVGGVDWVQEQAHTPNVDVAAAVEKGKSAFVGPELYRKTLGVIGLGAIGALVCNIGLDLGMDVYGYDPYLSVDAALRLDRHVHVVKDVNELYKVSDYVTIHVPYTSSTKDFINGDAIAKMKGGVRILNLARGELVCDQDMIAALETGRVAKYVTDFPNDTIATVKNVIAMPHLGASTPESEENCASMGAEELIDFLEHGNIQNSVNLPTVHMDPNGAARMTVVHKNQPNMIATITDTISKDGMNIAAFTDKNRGEIAYSIIDTDTAYSAGVVADIEKIDGVIRVRVIQD